MSKLVHLRERLGVLRRRRQMLRLGVALAALLLALILTLAAAFALDWLFDMTRVQRAISSMRSGTVKTGDLPSFSRTETSSPSKRRAARRMMSRWPLVSGSNDPG